MPTYDYLCSSCGATTEIVHSIHGSVPGACPACGAEGTLTKAFNPPTIHFKGSGWAKKDRSGGRPKAAKSSDSTESGSAKPGGEGKGGEGKAGEGKAGEGKGGEGKGADSAGSAGSSGGGESGGSQADSGSASGDTKAAASAASSASVD
jgi:putative FmdB family regulatory protein